MSQRIAPTYVRVEFSAAVKREAWARCGGRCEGCGRPLEGVRHVYDHKWPLRLGGDASLENAQVLCDEPFNGDISCNERKTAGLDLPGIAAAKRYAKNRLPLDIGRPEKKPGKIKSPGFQKGGPSRPIPSRQFPKRGNHR